MVVFLRQTSSSPVIDARTVDLPTVTQLSTHFQDNKCISGNGDVYKIYVGDTKALVPISQLYSYGLNGYLPTESQSNFQQALKDAWNDMSPGKLRCLDNRKRLCVQFL